MLQRCIMILIRTNISDDDSLALAFVNDFGVYLGGADVGVAKQFRHGVQVSSVGQCEGCEGVACDVKGDVL